MTVVAPALRAGAENSLGAPVFGPRTATATILGDSNGGQPAGPVRCAPGAVVTDLQALQQSGASYLTGAGIQCRSLFVDGGLGFGDTVEAGSFQGNEPVGATFDSACPAGSVVTGLTGRHGFLVDQLQAVCTGLNPDGTFGEVSYGAPAGGEGGTAIDTPALCPPGAVATGIVGRAGDSLDLLTLECQSLTFQQPLPTNLSWPTATLLQPNDDVDDTLGSSGTQLWYKVPVQPGSRVTVDLSNLPANYDLAVFNDIGQAFNSLTTTADLTKLSAEFAGDAFAPSVFTPSVFTPSVFTPSVFTPSVFTPSVFTPSVFTPSVFTPSVFTPSVFTPSVFTPSVFTPSVFTPSVNPADAFTGGSLPGGITEQQLADAFSSAQTRSLLGVSANDGNAPESLSLATWNNTGYFYIRVVGRNGSFSPNQFHLRVRTDGGPCSGVTLDNHAGDPTIVGHSGPQTLILTDPTRLAGSDADKAALASNLTALAAATNGTVVDLADSPKVVALNQQADGPGVACTYAKNLVAQSIRDIVNSYRGNLKYVVLVGGDHVIPFFRYPDAAGLGPESNYVPPVLDSSASQASLRSNDVLGQDAYGALTDVSIKGSTLPVPDLAVGRLVETAGEINANVQRYLADNGAAIQPQSSLVIGYDFLTDAADQVEGDLSAAVPGNNATLITNADVPPSTTTVGGTPDRQHSWTATDLANTLLTSRHDITFLAGHFSANSALAADYSTSLLTTQLASAPPGTFANTLVFSAGCHSGYNIVDSDGVPGVTVGLDWAQAFAQQGATLVAGTGYQYGDTDFVKYGEKLYSLFAHDLRYGTGSNSVGQTLVQAKLDYLSGLTTVTGIDQKTLLESTVFGLPMQGVDFQQGRLPEPGTDPTQADPQPFTSDPGLTLGLTSSDLDVMSDLTPHTVPLASSAGGTVNASYLSGPDGVVNNPGEPTIPLDSVNVSDPNGSVLRGVGFRSGTYTDTPGVTPLVGVATTEQSGAHTPFVSPTWFPNKIASPNYFGVLAPGGDGTTRLSVTPVQHRSDPGGGTTDTQRKYSDLGFRLYYSGNIRTYGTNQPALAAPPSITGVTSSLVGTTLHVETHVVGDPSAGIQGVWITYTSDDGTWNGRWASLDLTQDGTDSTLWAGDLTLPGDVDPAGVHFLVQAVNGVGLVGVDDNQGYYYTPAVVPGVTQQAQAPTTLTTGSAPATVAYGDTPSLTATLTDATGNGIANEPVTFTLGGSSITGTTGSDGVANVNLPASVVPGAYPLTTSFAGDTGLASATGSPTPSITVTKAPTTLTALAGTTNGVAATATLSAGSAPLRQRTVLFVLNNATTNTLVSVVPAITDGTGTATLPSSALPLFATSVTAIFGSASAPLPAGGTTDLSDPDYAGATSTALLIQPVARSTSLTLATPPTSVTYGSSLSVSATLTSGGAPLSGQQVTFALGSLTAGATTGADGVASTTIPVTLDPGNYTLSAGFAGAGAYTASADPGTSLTVTQAPTALAIAPGASPLEAARATLTTGGSPLATKSVTFVLRDLRTGAVVDADTVTSGADGVAVLPYSEVAPRGNATVQAYFGSASTPQPGGTPSDLSDLDYSSSTSSTIVLATTTHLLNTTVIGRPYSTTIPVSRSATVTVTGLPTGLSLSRPKSGWTISGTSPRRAGWYTVAVTSQLGTGPLTTTWYVIVVQYATTPFAQPVNDPPGRTASVFPASSAVPLRITLTDYAGVPIPDADAAAIAAGGRAYVSVVQIGTTKAKANETKVSPQAGWGTTFTYSAATRQFVYYANPAAFHWVAGRTYALTILVRTDPGRLVAAHTVIVGFASG